VGKDGVVRARRALSTHGIAQNLVSTPLFEQARRADIGTYVAKSNIDGAERIYGFANLTSYPLMVAIGLSRDEVLAPLRGRSQTYLLLGAASSLVILALTFIIAWQSQRRR